MKVLFIGGTGNISEAVSRLAVEKGIDLYLLNRGNRGVFFPEGAKHIKGDIREPAEVSKVLRDYQFDVVVNWIAYTPEHVQTDLELFKGKIGQYIFISTASIFQKPARNYLISESTPAGNPYWQYSQNKLACEELLIAENRNHGFPVTIVRPSNTYGVSMIPSSLNCWTKPWTLIDRIRKGKKVVIHGDGTSLWVLTHNTDFAKGFIGLIGNMRTIGHPFIITSDEVLTWNMIYEAMARAAGAKLNAVHIPSEFLAAVVPEAEGRLLGDKTESVVFDNSKIKRFVPEYLATVPFAEGIKRSVQWFDAHPEYCKIDEGWNSLMDKVITEYEAAVKTAQNKILSTAPSIF
ncbi:MAG TPA: SDR family oxidoreductase [Bacillota bacterium]|nr:SDR family oxidoreductase [Bacillota bacterium]